MMTHKCTYGYIVEHNSGNYVNDSRNVMVSLPGHTNTTVFRWLVNTNRCKTAQWFVTICVLYISF